MRSLLLAALVTLAVPVASFADDIFLQWDDCPPAGAGLKTFACDTNTGSRSLIFSFESSVPISNFNGMDGDILVIFPSATLPSWWNFGGCRASTSLQFSTLYPETCTNPWIEGTAGGLQWSQFFTSTWWRIRIAQAIPVPANIEADVRYYAFRVLIHNARTTGTGACPGCDVPAALIPRFLKIYTQGATNDRQLFVDGNLRDDPMHYARWQCDGAPVWDWDTPGGLIGWNFGPGCTVPARKSTWGSVKSLYR